MASSNDSGSNAFAVQVKIKGLSQYEDRSSDIDVLSLIKEVKAATPGIDKKSDPRSPLIYALAVIFKMKQGGSEANENYLERFKANVGVVELAQGRNVFCSHGIIQNLPPTSDDINI